MSWKIQSRRRRAFRWEQLEERQMLAGGPPLALDDSYWVGPSNPLVINSATNEPGFRLLNKPVPQDGFSGGSSIVPEQFLMHRFSLFTSDPLRTARIGGHFGGFNGGHIFGAIVALSGPDDVPDSADLSTPDVLGAALLPVSEPSSLTSAALSVELSPGYYAAVFGTGRFGATADGFAPTIYTGGSDNFLYTSNGGWSTQPNHTFHAFVDAVGVLGGVLANDRDFEGDTLTATLESGPEHGTLTLLPDGRFTYHPDGDFQGIDLFRYIVSDGTSESHARAFIGVSATRPEAPPFARQDTYFLPGGNPYEGSSVLANDTGAVRARRVTGPEHGTLELRADGTFQYTPDAGFTGQDIFYYQAGLGTLLSGPTAVFLNVAPVNDPPVARDDSYRIEAGETLMSGVGERLASAIYFTDEGLLSLNRAPIDGDSFQRFRSLTYSASSIALDLEHDMVYWYIGAPEYRIYRAPVSGGPQQLVVQMPEVEFEWEGGTGRDHPSVRDMAIDVEAGKLYWTTNSVQDVYPAKLSRSNLDGSDIEDLWTKSPFGFPTGIDLDLQARKVYWMNESQVLRTDMDAPRVTEIVIDGLPGSSGLISGLALDVSRGKLFWAEGQVFSSARVRFANLDGSDAKTLFELERESMVADMAVDPARGKLYWSDWWFDTISRVNLDGTDSEVVLRSSLTNPYGLTLDQEFPDNYVYGVLANDFDLNGDALTATVITGPQHGQLELNPNGSFKYVPATGFVGRDQFTYIASDGESQSPPATVTIQVGNAAPVANPDAYEIREDSLLRTTLHDGVLANDEDENPAGLRAELVSGPAHGSLEFHDQGQFIYHPAPNFFGEDTFVYRASDGEQFSEPATVTITVTPVNDVPIASRDFRHTRQGQALSFAARELTANDFDADGDALTVTTVSATAQTHGTVALSENGTVTYTPAAGFVGTARFAYTVSDGNGGEATGEVQVEVERLVQNTAGKAHGQGTLDGRRRSFNFNVHSRATSTGHRIDGHLFFADLEVGFFFRSTRITGFRIEADGRLASFSGVGVLNGRSGVAFTVFVEDNAGPNRSRDTFRIVLGRQGLDYDSLDLARNGGRIDRPGDIRVEPRRNVPMPIALARGLVLASMSNEGRYETLVERLARGRLVR